jgi:general secretion pathway protein D
LAGGLLALLLNGCATPPPADGLGETVMSRPAATGGEGPRLVATPESAATPEKSSADPATRATMVLPGTGNFIDQRTASRPAPVAPTAPGEVTLNFEEADIRDVVKVVFDTLKENYTIDPRVQGAVTVQTSRPLTKDLLLPTLETLLRMNDAVLIRDGGVYQILPAAGAIQQGGLAPRLSGGRVGYGVRIVPLRYISAIEMQTIIAPFLPEGGVLKADVARNLLILAGTPQELASVQTTIDTFDVNWLKGMSIGMFRLRNVDSQAMANELNQAFGAESGTPIAGLLRFVSLSKLNAVLVITPQVEYLKDVATWIERLDGVGGERLYVYSIQNGRAEYIAELLNGLFNLGGGGAPRGGDLAPGLRPTQLSGGLGSSGGGAEPSGSAGSSAPAGAMSARGGRSGGGSSVLGSGGPSAGMEEVRIVADTENNSLLIWATNQNYERIINTLEKMDVTPRQVLIEATIAEVTLTGSLRYGIQWYFSNDVGSDRTGVGSLGLPANLTLTNALRNIPTTQFSYAITDSAGLVRALLNTLAGDSKVKVLSSPQVMVVDNQQAVIRVGAQQPVRGSTAISDGIPVESIDFKPTGVLLEVLPRVNDGGMVNMEIKQEVTDVGPIDAATGQRSFLERSVVSRVAVRSGQTLVLGGLIRDNRTERQSGIPVLYKIPVLGALFGSTEEEMDRTELIVLITPRVVRDSQEADQVTEEIQRKMREVAPVIKSTI